MLDMEEIALNKAGMYFRAGARAELYNICSTLYKQLSKPLAERPMEL